MRWIDLLRIINYFCVKMDSNYIQHYSQNNFSLEVINPSYLDWSDWVILGVCILTIVISRILNYEYLNRFYKKFYTFSSSNKASIMFLVINFIFVSSFFVKQILVSFSFATINNWLLYVYIIVSISSLIILKFLIIYSLRWLFNFKTNYIIPSHLKFFQILGLILLPIFILTYFIANDIKPYVYLVGFMIYSFLIVLREIQLFLIAFKQKISFLYIILYLCTLEILPLILFIKMFIG